MSDDAALDSNAQYINWKNWSGKFGQVTRADHAYFDRELRPLNLPKDATVLEIGFGAGAFLGYCRASNYSVTGTEMNDHLVSEAQAGGFVALHAEKLSTLPKGSFDLVVAFDVLEHIAKTDIPGFLRTLHALLRPDGKILLRFPNGDSWLGRINQNGDPTHVSEVGFHMLEYFAAETSLRILQFRMPRSPGFAAGLTRGVQALFGRPVARLIGVIQKAIYFPGSPIVLSSKNVVAVLAKAPRGQ